MIVVVEEVENARAIALGNRLRELREARGWRQNDLEAISKVSASNISKIENAKSSPSIYVLTQLAQALEVTVAFLIGEDSEDIQKEEKEEHIRLLAMKFGLDPDDLRAWIEALDAMPPEVRDYELQGAKLRARGSKAQEQGVEVHEMNAKYEADSDAVEG